MSLQAINEYIEKNKFKFNSLYEDLGRLGAAIATDHQSLIKIHSEIPHRMNEEEEFHLRDLLKTVEVGEKMYEIDLRNNEEEIKRFEDNTALFINSIPNTKGPISIARGSLIQLTTDQTKLLNERHEETKQKLFELLRKLKDFDTVTGGSQVNYKKIKEFIQAEIARVAEELLGPSINLIQNRKSNEIQIHGKVDNIVNKFENVTNEVSEFKEEISSVINEIIHNFNELANNLKELENNHNQHAYKIKDLGRQIGDELDSLKFKMNDKFNYLEDYVQNNSIKKYYV